MLRGLTDAGGLLIWLKAEQKHGGAGESRTPDLRFRKPPLYPSELQPRHQGPDSLHPSRRKVPNIPNRAIPGGRGTFAAVSCIQMDHSLEHWSCARAKGKTPSILNPITTGGLPQYRVVICFLPLRWSGGICHEKSVTGFCGFHAD
jgi:hypothetical protein